MIEAEIEGVEFIVAKHRCPGAEHIAGRKSASSLAPTSPAAWGRGRTPRSGQSGGPLKKPSPRSKKKAGRRRRQPLCFLLRWAGGLGAGGHTGIRAPPPVNAVRLQRPQWASGSTREGVVTKRRSCSKARARIFPGAPLANSAFRNFQSHVDNPEYSTSPNPDTWFLGRQPRENHFQGTSLPKAAPMRCAGKHGRRLGSPDLMVKPGLINLGILPDAMRSVWMRARWADRRAWMRQPGEAA